MPVGGVMRKKFFPFSVTTYNSETCAKTFFGFLVALVLALPAMGQSGRWKNDTASYPADAGNKSVAGQDQPLYIPLPQDGRRSWTVRIEEVNGRQVAILESQEVAPEVLPNRAPSHQWTEPAAQPTPPAYRETAVSDRVRPVIYASAAPGRGIAAPSAPARHTAYTPTENETARVATRRKEGPTNNTSPILAYESSAPSDRLYTPPSNGATPSGSPYEGRRWKVTAVSYGLASWYGGKYQGRRTANGEVFDMYQYTAAHRTIAFGSKVRVTNLSNNKSVIVRVNDRGPFTNDGRVIDLAMQAAQDIDMIKQGVGRVKLELLEEETGQFVTYTEETRSPAPNRQPSQYPTIEQTQPERYTVQVAATGDAQRARMQANQLSGGWVHATQLNGNALYRVNIGRFTTKADAEFAANQIRNNGRDALVKQIQN